MGLSHYYQFNVFCVTRTPFVYTIFCFVFAYRYVNGIFLKNFRVFGDIVTNRYKTGSKANNNTKVLSYNNRGWRGGTNPVSSFMKCQPTIGLRT